MSKIQQYECINCNNIFYAYKLAGGIDRKYCSKLCADKDRIKSTRNFGFCKPKFPILEPTKDLCYILGVLKGDGFVYSYKNNKKSDDIIGLNVNDIEFANSFRDSLANINLNPRFTDTQKYVNSTTKYNISCNSKTFVNWYKNLTLEDIKNIIQNNEEFIFSFIRGVYESEGSLLSYDYPGKRFLMLCISSSNYNLLCLIKDLLFIYGFEFKILKLNSVGNESTLKNGKTIKTKVIMYRLYMFKKDKIIEVLKKINPSIKRKGIDKILSIGGNNNGYNRTG